MVAGGADASAVGLGFACACAGIVDTVGLAARGGRAVIMDGRGGGGVWGLG